MGHHPRTLAVDPVSALSRAAAGSPAATRPRAEWVTLASVAAAGPAWQELAARAREPNVFYEPAFALPAAAAFGRDTGAILVWSARRPGRLIGFFPARIERRRYLFGPSMLAGWTHPYAPFGVPLVDRDETQAAIAAWLDCIAGVPDLPKLVLLPLLPTDGAFATALRAALSARDARCQVFGQHARALLAPQGDRTTYLQGAVSARKRKELRRQRRRLDDRGCVTVDTVSSLADMPAALAGFMELEARGWKGAAGTAATLDSATRRFLQDAVTGLAARSQAQIKCLHLDGRLVAAAILLRSGAHSWFWKIAYDEEAARASPGAQLTLELTRSLLSDATLAQVDSCATPDHPMIDHFWRERLMLSDLLIDAAPGAASVFALTRGFEQSRRRLIGAAKWARSRLRP